jgi:hypothetical protein
MSLGLSEPPSRYSSSSTFNTAVNDAQFVRTFGIIAVVGSLLTFISGAVAIGLGMAVLGFGHSRFFKIVGGLVIALGLASFLSPFFGIAGSLALSSGVVVKSVEVLGVLGREGKDDPDWAKAQLRSIVGLVGSGLGVLIGLCWAGLLALGWLLTSR